MPTVNLNRGVDAVYVARSSVVPGQVFAAKTREGHSKNLYASIGSNGRMYSVNLQTGELASSDNDEGKVAILGTFKYVLNSNPTPAVERDCLRSEVTSGEVFTVKGKNRSYLHIGEIDIDQEGWLSVPVDNTENHAVGQKGDGHVHVTGTFVLEATLTK